MIVPKPVTVSLEFETGTTAEMEFPGDFLVSELRDHIQLAAGMLEVDPDVPDFVILHKERVLEDGCRLDSISKSDTVLLTVRSIARNSDQTRIEEDCSQIGQITRRLLEHANEDAEFVQQHHIILENQRMAQTAVMNAWSQYASVKSSADQNRENPLMEYLNKSNVRRS
jgi:hypothetical protein